MTAAGDPPRCRRRWRGTDPASPDCGLSFDIRAVLLDSSKDAPGRTWGRGCCLWREGKLIEFVELSRLWDRVPTNICRTFVQCWNNVEDVGPTLYKCSTKVLCLLGADPRDFDPMLVQCYAGVVEGGLTLNLHWVNEWCVRTCRKLGPFAPPDDRTLISVHIHSRQLEHKYVLHASKLKLRRLSTNILQYKGKQQ